MVTKERAYGVRPMLTHTEIVSVETPSDRQGLTDATIRELEALAMTLYSYKLSIEVCEYSSLKFESNRDFPSRSNGYSDS